MSDDLVPMDANTFGPCMKALPSPRMRLFVMAYCENGANATEAARAAGYKDSPSSKSSTGKSALRVWAHELVHREDVKNAIREECQRRLAFDLPVLVGALRKVALDPQHKDQVKAALALMNRGGLPDVKETTVRHEIELSSDEKWTKIAEIFSKAGLPVPPGAPKTIDVTPAEVTTDGKIRIGDEEF